MGYISSAHVNTAIRASCDRQEQTKEFPLYLLKYNKIFLLEW